MTDGIESGAEDAANKRNWHVSECQMGFWSIFASGGMFLPCGENSTRYIYWFSIKPR